MASHGTNSFMPLWGGLSALVGSPWTVYTNTHSGIRDPYWFFKPFGAGMTSAPLRQRVITSGLSTAGVPLGLADESGGPNYTMPELPNTGEDDMFVPLDRPIDDQHKALPKTTWEFSMSPFRLVLRAITFPIIGAIDIAAQKALPVVYTIISLVYQSLPMTSIVRISRFVRIWTKSPQYRHSPPIGRGPTKFCPYCQVRFSAPKRFGKMPPSWVLHGCYQAAISTSIIVWLGSARPLYDIAVKLDVTDPDWKPTCGSFIIPVVADRSRRIAELLGITLSKNCTHPIPDHTHLAPRAHVPSPTIDGLFENKGHHIWRSENRGNGVRCVDCYPNTIHNWNPDIVRGLRNFQVFEAFNNMTPSEQSQAGQLVLLCIYLVKFMMENLSPDARYTLTAVTSSRVDSFHLMSSGGPVIVLVDSSRTADLVIRKYPVLASPLNLVMTLPTIGNESSFASWRLLFAAICPVPCSFHIVNQRMTYYDPLAAHVLTNFDISWSSSCVGHVFPFYMGNAIIRGGESVLTVIELATMFYISSYIYGWDEIVPALWQPVTVVIISDPGIPEVMAPIVTNRWPPFTLALFKLTTTRSRVLGSYVADFTRENIYLMKSLSKTYVETGKVTMAHSFMDPRVISEQTVTLDYQEWSWTDIGPYSERFHASTAPGENILNEISHTHGGIIFFTFGSRGDRSPITCNAKYIARLGAKVTVIHLNTEGEGRMLANTEMDRDMEKVKIFARAREYLSGFEGLITISPHQLLWFSGLTYTLAPPEDIIHPFVSSSNVMLAVAFSILGSIYEPSFRIGSFATSRCLPTSADGEKFMEHRLNTAKPGTIGAWWGGDGAPIPGWEHITLIPPGDHQEIFPTYETIVTKGTVGTVALASLCGAKVLAVGSGLDRDYRNPYDAGQGFIGMQNPDRIFLALAGRVPAYFGIWVRANWYNIRELWAWYGPEGLGLAIFRLLMFYLYVTRLQKASLLSASPLTTLILMIDGRSTIPIRTYLLYLVGAKVMDTMLKVLSKNYFWLIQRFYEINLRLFSSALAIWVAQNKSWLAGMALAWGLNILEGPLFWLLNWVPITLGLAPVESAPDDEFAVFEFVLLYRVIPVLHTAMVFPKAGIRVEGADNRFGLYAARATKGGFHSPFVFPSRILLSEVLSSLKNPEALPYGPTWHCYSVILSVIGGKTARMGIAAIPYYATVAFSSILSGLAFASLGVFYTIATTIPAIGGVSYRQSGLLTIISNAIRNTVVMVETARGDYMVVLNTWFARLTYLAPIPSWLHH